MSVVDVSGGGAAKHMHLARRPPSSSPSTFRVSASSFAGDDRLPTSTPDFYLLGTREKGERRRENRVQSRPERILRPANRKQCEDREQRTENQDSSGFDKRGWGWPGKQLLDLHHRVLITQALETRDGNHLLTCPHII
jgi:hypothetical protein